MNVVLFDDSKSDNLLPLTSTRPVAALRVGILTIAEKWEKRFDLKVSYITKDYLQAKYPLVLDKINLFINGGCLPTQELLDKILKLNADQSLITESGKWIAYVGEKLPDSLNQSEVCDADFIEFPEDIFSKNANELEVDFNLITTGRTSAELSSSNTVVGEGKIFIESSAKVEGAILNASSGSIYVGNNAEIMEGALVRGGLAMCEGAVLKLGAKIYGATTVGPHSKVGGEVNNSVILGYSNKGHDGFLGNSVLGEWCNLGADTNNSNLKNNYANVKLWDYTTGRFRDTQLQFCGLIMGDHSKCGINTMFNTGTVVGVSSNLFGSGFPRNYVPSFAWGGSSGYSTYQLKKALETAKLVMSRRGIELDTIEEGILTNVFTTTQGFRFWEKK